MSTRSTRPCDHMIGFCGDCFKTDFLNKGTANKVVRRQLTRIENAVVISLRNLVFH